MKALFRSESLVSRLCGSATFISDSILASSNRILRIYFPREKVILWMKLSLPFDWWLNHNWHLGKVWRYRLLLLIRLSVYWGRGLLPFYSRHTLQAYSTLHTIHLKSNTVLFCLKVRKGNIINVNNKQYNPLYRNNLLSII